jgi:hypothetical protein
MMMVMTISSSMRVNHRNLLAVREVMDSSAHCPRHESSLARQAAPSVARARDDPADLAATASRGTSPCAQRRAVQALRHVTGQDNLL